MQTRTEAEGQRQRAEYIETIVIGGGQAGLSAGYHLARRQRPFVILDASERVGDAWRQRWDSLRLFTAARYNGLDGLPFPADPHYFPTKDEMGDYLESYAATFDLPVRTGVRVERLSREGERFVLETADQRLEADNVVVAMGNHQHPKVPAFAGDLDPGIVQFHSAHYRNPSQLTDGDVLLVGAGNSASELAVEFARNGHHVVMAGRDTGHIPFRIERWFGRTIGVRFVLRFLFRKVLSVRTPIGRSARPKILSHGGPLIRVKPKDLAAAGVERVGRVEAVRDGRPVLADGSVLDVPNVVWCTGYRPGFDWIDLPVHGEGEPLHESGIVPTQPGLYFVGLVFLDSMSSEMVQGVGRDADRVVRHLDARMAERTAAPATTGTRELAEVEPAAS